MYTYDISPAELTQAYDAAPRRRETAAVATRGRDGRRIVKAKYRHPETNQTWTGRGRPPRWLTEAELEGIDRSHFEIGTAMGIPRANHPANS
ncbi:H-NS family nucleoid-associated regulatory protein [Achromobacter animicus]|uniref:H-NS histone family protein n=1 Tax=Achromobacter animicus TaxID=1389935 RepID=UPI003C7D37A7